MWYGRYKYERRLESYYMIFMMPKFGRNIRPKSKIWKSLLYDITFNISFWEYLPRISFFSSNELLSIGSSRQKRKNVEDINFLKVDPLDFQSILSWPPPWNFFIFFLHWPSWKSMFFPSKFGIPTWDFNFSSTSMEYSQHRGLRIFSGKVHVIYVIFLKSAKIGLSCDI